MTFDSIFAEQPGLTVLSMYSPVPFAVTTFPVTSAVARSRRARPADGRAVGFGGQRGCPGVGVEPLPRAAEASGPPAAAVPPVPPRRVGRIGRVGSVGRIGRIRRA